MNTVALAEQLNTLKRVRGWTDPEIADRLGVHRVTVARWRAGTFLPDHALVLRALHDFIRRNMPSGKHAGDRKAR